MDFRNKTRVLFISAGCNEKSGAFLSMAVLISLLQEKHNTDCLVVLPKHGSGERILKKYNIEYIVIRAFSWITVKEYKSFIEFLTQNCVMLGKVLFTRLISDKRISSLINAFMPDVIHINELGTFLGANVALNKGIPLVWHMREFLEEDHGTRIWCKKYGFELLNRAAELIAISESVKKKYAYTLNNASIRMIYNGIKPELFNYNEVEKLDPIYIVCIGSLSKGKRQDLVIRALGEIANQVSRTFVLHIVGSGTEEEFLKELAVEIGLKDQIIFDGFQSNVSGYFSLANIAVVPSVSEAFGRITVEAMLSGTLVIGADTAGTREILGDEANGIMFRADDVRDLSVKLLEAINHYESKIEVIRNGRMRAEEMFSAEKNAKNISKLYDEILFMKRVK